MKHLLFIFLFALTSFFANAQTGTGTLSATITLSGGDGSAKVVSVSWATQGTPPGPVRYANQNAATTDFTVSVPGIYTFIVTVKDNSGKTATDTWIATAYLEQSINVDASKSTLRIVIRKQ